MILRELGAKKTQSRTLNNIGFAEKESGHPERALGRYQEALALSREAGDRPGEAILLGNLGATYSALGHPQRAAEILEQSLDVQREVHNQRGEATTLHALGAAHAALGDWARAEREYRDALTLQSELGDRDGSSRSLASLAAAARALGQPALAIFFGKVAVNAVQKIRAEIQTLPPEVRNGFLRTRVGLYRALGDQLLDAGRLPEAQQVLGLAKEEEYGSFIRAESVPPPVDRSCCSGTAGA